MSRVRGPVAPPPSPRSTAPATKQGATSKTDNGAGRQPAVDVSHTRAEEVRLSGALVRARVENTTVAQPTSRNVDQGKQSRRMDRSHERAEEVRLARATAQARASGPRRESVDAIINAYRTRESDGQPTYANPVHAARVLARELSKYPPEVQAQLLAQLQQELQREFGSTSGSTAFSLILRAAGGDRAYHSSFPITSEQAQVIAQALAKSHELGLLDIRSLAQGELRLTEHYLGSDGSDHLYRLISLSGSDKLKLDYAVEVLKEAGEKGNAVAARQLIPQSGLLEVLNIATAQGGRADRIALLDAIVNSGLLASGSKSLQVELRSALASFFGAHSREIIEHYVTGFEQVSENVRIKRWTTLSQFFRSVLFTAPPIQDEAMGKFLEGLATTAEQIRDERGLEIASRILGRLDGTISYAFEMEVASRGDRAKAIQDIAKMLGGMAGSLAGKQIGGGLAVPFLKKLGEEVAIIASKPLTPETLADGQTLSGLRRANKILFGIVNQDGTPIWDGNADDENNIYLAAYDASSISVRNELADNQIRYAR